MVYGSTIQEWVTMETQNEALVYSTIAEDPYIPCC